MCVCVCVRELKCACTGIEWDVNMLRLDRSDVGTCGTHKI